MPQAAVLALFGPTGVGKTAVAVALADRLRSRGQAPVAISADALAVYRGLELLSGAPDEHERTRLEHRLVSFLPVTARFSAGEYAQLAHAEIDRLLAEGRRPIVVGGTGLYLRAALADLELRPPPPPGVRERLQAELAAHGPAALHRRLAERAPAAAQDVDPRDGRRLVRALELLEAGRQPAPRHQSQLWTRETRHPTLLVAMVMERAALYSRVEARVDAMVAAGAAEEVTRADADGASATARQAVGFPELLAGDVEGMKRRTRQLAKRQHTWMRKLAGVHRLDVTGREPAAVAAEIDALEQCAEAAAAPPGRG